VPAYEPTTSSSSSGVSSLVEWSHTRHGHQASSRRLLVPTALLDDAHFQFDLAVKCLTELLEQVERERRFLDDRRRVVLLRDVDRDPTTPRVDAKQRAPKRIDARFAPRAVREPCRPSYSGLVSTSARAVNSPSRTAYADRGIALASRVDVRLDRPGAERRVVPQLPRAVADHDRDEHRDGGDAARDREPRDERGGVVGGVATEDTVEQADDDRLDDGEEGAGDRDLVAGLRIQSLTPLGTRDEADGAASATQLQRGKQNRTPLPARQGRAGCRQRRGRRPPRVSASSTARPSRANAAE